MSRIEGYSSYAMNLYENAAQRKTDEKDGAVTQKTQAAQTTPVELSDDAQKLLEQLKEKYKDMDFMVANYTEENASEYLSRGTKEYSVLIDPETLEKMAADEKTKKEYTDILDNAKTDFANMKEQLGDEGKEVTHMGITFDSNGKKSYFAELEEMSDKQKERIEKNRAEKKEEKASAEKKKRAKVQADSIEELREKIKNIDWSTIKAEETQVIGGKIDVGA